MTVMKTTVRNGRIDVPAPSGLPDGTEVLLTIGTDLSEEKSVPREEMCAFWRPCGGAGTA